MIAWGFALESMSSVHALIAPTRHLNTDCRSKPTGTRRPFLPVRTSASTSPARAVKPSALSSSRYASSPAPKVITAPRDWSKRRSKSSLGAPPYAAPP